MQQQRLTRLWQQMLLLRPLLLSTQQQTPCRLIRQQLWMLLQSTPS
jgi:hypothetical protein